MRIPVWSLLLGLVAWIGCSQQPAPNSKNDSPSIGPNMQNAVQKDEWPFQDAENTATITLKRIMDGSKPILYVVHDEEGDWQFLDGGDVSEEDAATVSLKRVAELDPTVKSLSDLPVGWVAERESLAQPWQRSQRQ